MATTMTYEQLRIRRKQIAQRLYDALTENPPPHSIRVDSPDDLGAVGVQYGDGTYMLITQEDS